MILVSGCTVEELNLTSRNCPCVSGWVCDRSRDECVRAVELDAGAGADAGVDASSVDSGGSDAGSDSGLPPPVDSGREDAGSVSEDAGDNPGLPSLCSTVHSARDFCDGFDTGDARNWNVTGETSSTPGRNYAVTSPVYRGSHSMRFECPGGCSYVDVGASVWPPPGSIPSDLWMRAYYYFPSEAPAPQFVMHVISDDPYDQRVDTEVQLTGMNYHSHDGLFPPSGVDRDFALSVPRDRWICVEMHVRTTSSGGGVELFFDGERLGGELTHDGSPTPGNRLDWIYTGIVSRRGTTELVVYVDEVVADGERIGCDD